MIVAKAVAIFAVVISVERVIASGETLLMDLVGIVGILNLESTRESRQLSLQ